MLISVVFPAGRCTRYLPLKQKAPTVVRPWLQPATCHAQHDFFFFLFRNLASLHFKYFRGRRRTTRTEMSSSRQAEAGATQGYNCLLYFHFPLLSASRNDPEPRKRLRSTGVCRSPHTTDWWTGSRRSAGRGCSRTCYSSGQRANK